MWTEQTVETLRRLALEGRSAAWIAEALGAPSRNSVIGKANRIGIKLNGARSTPYGDGMHGAASAAASRRRRSPSIDGAQASDAPREGSVPQPRNRVPAVRRAKGRVGRSAFAHADVGEMRRIGLSALGEAECRWPLGDPGEEDFVYCGLQVATGHPYCPGHCRLVYRCPTS